MQAGKMRWTKAAWRIVERLLISVFVLYGAIFVLDKNFPDRFYECGRDTMDLKGGVKIFDGRKYRIVLCGTGGDESRMNDKIRLQVFSENGVLLAQRKFYVNWMMTNWPNELEYGSSYLIYYDASRQDNSEHRISMPPTWWDWVRARLPLLS
ncbi:hypothetical protein AB1286_03990 [Trinickia sp. NRRL B-1857]|uniref:hypothetical protein n=1 Tax=Trinickia sp. NRRL B-1857 TaxID=3162879 RepID=UPI003D2C23FD